MDVLAAAAMGEAMEVVAHGAEAELSGDTRITMVTADSMTTDLDEYAADNEDDSARRSSAESRSCDLEVMETENQPLNMQSNGDTHPLSQPNASPANTAVGTDSRLTAEFVADRAVVLFPAGAGTPAVKPQQPPAVEKATYEFAAFVFAAAKKVPQIRGVLAREDISGYLAADLLGVELVGEARGAGRESLKIGESVRKAALALEQGEKAERNAAAAKKSRLRAAAQKDAGCEERLDSEVKALDAATAAACVELRRAEITVNGLPDKKTKIVERRLPDPTPIDLRRRACEIMFGSEEAVEAIDAAYACEDAESYWTQHDSEDDEDELQEKIDHAFVNYRYKLRKLKKAFPEELNDCSEEGVCAHRRLCPCGRGSMRGAWPWVVQTPPRGFCEVPRESRPAGELRGMFSCDELHEERERWRWALSWVGPDKAARRAEWGMSEKDFRARYNSFLRELKVI